jgi:hypothetical protein
MSKLIDFFGPSKEEILKKLSDETGADFVKGGYWKGDKVQLHVKNWTITLDIYTVSDGHSSHVYTRVRAPYRNKDGFRFMICRRNFLTDIQKFFGIQDVEIGEPEFDKDFIIQSNDEIKIKRLLANNTIREQIVQQPRVRFEVRDDEGWRGVKFPEDVDELIFKVHGFIRDVETLKALLGLFAETLNYLCQSGSASSYDPDVEL